MGMYSGDEVHGDGDGVFGHPDDQQRPSKTVAAKVESPFSAMLLLLSALRCGAMDFNVKTRELRFGQFMWATRGTPDDWATMVRLIGRSRIEDAIRRQHGGAT
jgi:hypothetical protein